MPLIEWVSQRLKGEGEIKGGALFHAFDAQHLQTVKTYITISVEGVYDDRCMMYDV